MKKIKVFHPRYLPFRFPFTFLWLWGLTLYVAEANSFWWGVYGAVAFLLALGGFYQVCVEEYVEPKELMQK